VENRVLIVDDNPDMRKSLGRILEMNGSEIRHAVDGAEAVEQCRDWGPDAVILDIRMPRMNGTEAYWEVRRGRPDLLVVLMTGFADALDEANQKILAEACEDQRVELMLKPLDLERLLALLRGEIRPLAQTLENPVEWLEIVDAARDPRKRTANHPE